MAQGYPKLIILSGGEDGKELALSGREQVTIGRSEDNNLQLADTSVSRRHASLIYKDNIWHLRDESSRNGSYINDNKIGVEQDVALSNMNIIRLGVYELRFVEKEASPSEIKDSSKYHRPQKTEPEINDVTDKERKENIDKQSVQSQETQKPAQTEEHEDSMISDSDEDDLLQHQAKGFHPDDAIFSKDLKVFMIIAAVFCVIGVILFFSYEYLNKKPDDQNADGPDVVEVDQSQKTKPLENLLPVVESKKSGNSQAQDAVTKDTKPEATQMSPSSDTKPETKTEQPQGEPTETFKTLDMQESNQDPSSTPVLRDFSVFLDVETQPLSANIYFGTDRLGRTPLKQSVSLKPNETYELFADFELRELNDIYRKKIEFKAKPDTDVIELKIEADLGTMQIIKLPRNVDFYLEGYYDYDKLKANPVKITDIIYGKPIYLPFGQYHVELREKTRIAGSDNLVTQIRFQRDYHINKDNRLLKISVTDRDLQFYPATIRSNPDNADVYYGAEKIGVTPYTGNLALGKNQIKIVKEGFFDSIIDVDMRMNTVYEVTVDLKTSKMGELINKAKEHIRNNQTSEVINTLVEALKYGGSSSEKAEVYFLLGDAYLSQKDVTQAMPYFEKAREHEQFFHRASLGIAKIYHEQKMNQKALKMIVEVLANIESNTPAAIHSEANSVFKLISPVKSVMYIYTEPQGAAVFVNDKKIAQDTPLILSDLGLGNYRLQFEKGGFQPYKTKQNLKIGEFVMIKVKLEPVQP